MHVLMLVTLTMLPSETSAEARQRIHDELTYDETFCGDGGRFGSPTCDWFVIGGRWSGHLRETLMGDAYEQKLTATLPQLTDRYSRVYRKERAQELNALWREFGGDGPSSLLRDDIGDVGYDDDAMPLDRALYEKLLTAHAGESISHGDDSTCEFVDLNNEELDETFIGRKWIAVVDYHC
jgi:hypothetical protein